MVSQAGEALPFSDDLLADILIRLPTLEDLGRACATCPAFRRVITSHSFLRRLHALHPPSLLGFHTFSALFHPVEPPHPSAPAARALAEAADFRFSFLPGPGFWMVRDAHAGRFVLDRDEGTDPAFTTIAVCDPLFRSYVLLPPIPQDLAAQVKRLVPVDSERSCHVFFAPCTEEEKAFSVVWMAECKTKVVAFLFSSASGQWRAIASSSWRDLNPAVSTGTSANLHRRSYAYGCFYWYLSGSGYPDHSSLIVLDIGRMRFYTVNYPFVRRFEEFAVFELEQGRRGMFMCDNNFYTQDSVQLCSASDQIHGEGANKWVLEDQITLSHSYGFNMLGVADGKLLLQGTRQGSDSRSEPELGCVSLDFKTKQVQRVRGMIHPKSCPMLAQYTGYPPSLSLPTI